MSALISTKIGVSKLQGLTYVETDPLTIIQMSVGLDIENLNNLV